MRVTILPSRAAGTLHAPPSKSMAHRLLICAGMVPGKTVVRGLEPSEDVLATMDCLRALHVDCVLDGGSAVVSGVGPHCGADGAVLPCRESGSTLRFFLPLCLFGPPMTLTGSRRLLSRPLDAYADICARQGIRFEKDAEAVSVRGTLRPGEFRMPGNVSSQYVSGLLFALPGLSGDSVISLTRPVESRSYIDMTLGALSAFGVRAAWRDDAALSVPGRQRFALPAGANGTVSVEGDWSNAAFLLALDRLGGAVELTGLDPESPQGDKVCAALFDRICARDSAPVDLSDCPDLGPVCMALAAAKGGARFVGTRRLRIKESDRCAAMAEELSKCGIRCEADWDSMTVYPGVLRAPEAPLSGHNDHRIVMAMSVLLTLTGGAIDGAEAVRKSWPGYFEALRSLGVRLRTEA